MLALIILQGDLVGISTLKSQPSSSLWPEFGEGILIALPPCCFLKKSAVAMAGR